MNITFSNNNDNDNNNNGFNFNTKKGNKIISLIVLCIFLMPVIRFCAAVVGDVTKIGIQIYKMAPIQEEFAIMTELDITKDNYDRPIKSTGELVEVEKAIKKYFIENSKIFKEIINIIENGAYLDIFKFEDYDENFIKDSIKTIDKTKKELQDNLNKLSEYNEEKLSNKVIDTNKTTKEYAQLYFEGIKEINESIIFKEKDKIKERIQETYNYLDGEKEILILLEQNKDAWHIEENKISFNDEIVENEYNNLIENLSN